MMDVWSWICELPGPDEWNKSALQFTLELARDSFHSSRSILLRAERAVISSLGSDQEASVAFNICLLGFDQEDDGKTLWVSDTCPLSSDRPFLPLVLQLLGEIISRAPTAHYSTCPRSQLQKLKPDPVKWIMDSHSPESFSTFFNVVFFTRLFWLCVFDAPSEVGSLYFKSLFSPNLESLSCKHATALRAFLSTVGVDAELCFMRAVGYMLAKWLILREVGVGLQTVTPSPPDLGFSYATEAHGFWTLKAYAPVLAMRLTCSSESKHMFPIMEAKESVLRYALAHQQLEAVIQLEHSVTFHDTFIEVRARVDNLRFHVVKLGFKKNDDVAYLDERHFPTRIRVWVGPEVGSTYVAGMSLGRSTDNTEKDVKVQKILKGKFGNYNKPKSSSSQSPSRVKATARTTIKTRTRSWRFDQDAEGNTAVFDAVLCDGATGNEAASWNAASGRMGYGMERRHVGAGRALTKSGGLVLGGDEYGEEVRWRVGKEMEGSVLKWRIGGKVWLSYWANEVKSSYFETRCVEWCDEVDLPLINSS